MSKQSKSDKQPQKYTAEALAKSKCFVDVQKDFLRVILGDGMYTIEEARAKIADFGKVGK